MPELPEVETVVRALRPLMTGQRLLRLTVRPSGTKVIATHSLRQLNRALTQQKIQQVQRRGKYILLMLEQGVLAFHLRMTGQLVVDSVSGADRRHLTATLECVGGRRLFFKDQRKFGRIYFWADLSEIERKLGPEPLSAAFTAAVLSEILKSSTRQIKALLLDQSKIAGLGNIYVDESLWLAGVNPQRPADSLTEPEGRRLHRAIRRVLQKSIEFDGTTFLSFQFGRRKSGRFRSQLRVFARQGQACRRCRQLIVKSRVAQRGTHFCPSCQRL